MHRLRQVSRVRLNQIFRGNELLGVRVTVAALAALAVLCLAMGLSGHG